MFRLSRKCVLLFFVIALFSLTACQWLQTETTQTSTSATTTATSSESTAPSTTTSETSTTAETTTETTVTTTSETTTEATTTEATTTEATTTETTPEASPTPSVTSPTPTVGPSLYSSYAFMVSYDPARAFADFDYFNMLKGDDAVAYLVEREGYTQQEAEDIVADYADSEFICQNDNPQLRTIDLRTVELKLMYQPDGTPSPDATPYDSDLTDLYDLYHVDPDLVLDSFFYHVTVEDGEVVLVEQVYWP